MKNRYEIRGDKVYISINSPEGEIETNISLNQLPRMDEYTGTWFAHWNVTSHSYYVWGNLSYINENDKKARKTIQLHQFIMQPPEGMKVDHIDRNPLNNDDGNLRVCTVGGNNQNLGHERSNNKTGYRGVRKTKSGYSAHVKINYKDYNLGVYPTPEEANIVASEFRAKNMEFAVEDIDVDKIQAEVDEIKKSRVRAKKSKYQGLVWYEKDQLWMVYRYVDDKYTYFGRYKNEYDAALVADYYERLHNGETEKVNFNGRRVDEQFVKDKQFHASFSKYRGLSKDKYGFVVNVAVNDENRYVGFYKGEILAAHAHDTFLRKWGGDLSLLNFPEDNWSEEEIANKKHVESGRTSKYRGVVYDKKTGKWKATVVSNKQKHYCGAYDTEEDATRAYDACARKLGLLDKLNFPSEIISEEDAFSKQSKFNTVISKTSKYKDVHWNGSRFVVQVRVDGKQKYIGRYKDEQVASIARDIALFKHYGNNLPKEMWFHHPTLFTDTSIDWSNVDPTTIVLHV